MFRVAYATVTKGKKPAPRNRRSATAVRLHDFTFLTNHGHVLICLAANPDITVREVAQKVGITERAVLFIVKDLTLAKVLAVKKEGRRNHYRIHNEVHLRHIIERHKTVGDLLRAILGEAS